MTRLALKSRTIVARLRVGGTLTDRDNRQSAEPQV